MRALRGRAAARPTRALQKAVSGRAPGRRMRALQKAVSALKGARPGEWRWRLIGRLCNGAAAACAAAGVLAFCAAGYSGIPGVGRVLDPGHGAWASATAAQVPRSQALRLPGLKGPAVISFDPHGMATVQAERLADSMLALGYLHARFRLAQMDLERRLAEGRLSQLIGAGGVASDSFELRLGLLRTARREWAALPKTGLAATMLTAYAHGVNDYLAQADSSGQWPAIYPVAGVYPARWTPVDSLAVQGYLAQQLDYTTAPLDYAVLARSLGIARVMRWIPVGLPGPQHPYDLGPYQARGVTAAGAAGGKGSTAAGTAARSGRPSAARASSGHASRQPSPAQPSAAMARSAAAVLTLSRNLPGWQAGRISAAGSAWAVNGSKVAGGGSILAGLARFPEPLSSSWFQVAVTVPGYDVTGVSLPGLPAVVIGHNAHIAWTLASAQNQSALYYVERTSSSRPGDYFWRNKWLPMRTVRYAIPVRGGPTRDLTVRLTVHGPVLTPSAAGETISVDWMGNGGSPDVAALARVGAASTFGGFRAALAGWRSPALTFGYADDRGNIGAVTAGSFPLVRAGTPWLPMTGTGADDVAGFIPDSALPSSYDPPGHVIALAGQPPVSAGYPYYLGTSANVSDALDQAAADYAELGGSGLTAAGVVALQTNPRSELAAKLLPRLLAALRQARLTPAEQQAVAALRGWDRTMAPGSPAAAIWWTFWSRYLAATFGPWWQAAGVPVQADPAGLGVSAGQAGLAVALEQWTAADQKNPVFRPPGAPKGTAVSAMRAAFGTAVSELQASQGGAPTTWALDRLDASPGVSPERIALLRHGRLALATGPWLAAAFAGPAAGAAADLTPAAVESGWRMIVRLGPRRGSIGAEGIYPGGQSGNPASPWYGNFAVRWRNGGYMLLPSAGTAASGPIRWELLP